MADKKTSGKRINAKEKILLSAEKLFARNGYESTSVNAIIEDAGVSKGAFYHHFTTKDDLISAIIEFEHQKNPTLPTEQSTPQTPEEKFTSEINRWFQALDDSKHLFVWMVPLLSHPIMKAKIQEMEPEGSKVKVYLEHLLTEIQVDDPKTEAIVLYHFFAGLKFELSMNLNIDLHELKQIILHKYLKNQVS